MKINRKDPRHWIYLMKSGAYIMASIALRPFHHKNQKRIISLYGHKYNGNLKAFGDYCMMKNEYEVCYTTLDPKHYEDLKNEDYGIEVLSLLKFRDVVKVSRSDVVISDRRAHALLYYLWLTKIPFIDVWHGIQAFKKFIPKDMAMLKKYNEIWVSSPRLKKIYINDYQLPAMKIKVTGYARVDAFVNGSYSKKIIRKKYNIENKFKKIILLAPTWQQDDPQRQIIPFSEDPHIFLSRLNEIAKKHNSLVIFRAHLNTNSQNKTQLASMNNLRLMSHNEYPQAEEFLTITDVFIGDWSSIAYDYLPLHRPTIFLDVPVPFKNGLTFGKSYRYGEVVKSLDELAKSLERYINYPSEFKNKYSEAINKAEKAAYGETLDGRSCERYYIRLKEVLQEK